MRRDAADAGRRVPPGPPHAARHFRQRRHSLNGTTPARQPTTFPLRSRNFVRETREELARRTKSCKRRYRQVARERTLETPTGEQVRGLAVRRPRLRPTPPRGEKGRGGERPRAGRPATGAPILLSRARCTRNFYKCQKNLTLRIFFATLLFLPMTAVDLDGGSVVRAPYSMQYI